MDNNFLISPMHDTGDIDLKPSKAIDKMIASFAKRIDVHQKKVLDYILVRYLFLIPKQVYPRISNRNTSLGASEFYLDGDLLFSYKVWPDIKVTIETKFPTDKIAKIKI